MKSLKAGKLKAGFLFILLLGELFSVKGQYKVSGEVIDVDYVFDDVRVALTTGGNREDIALTQAGKFDVYLEWNKVYQFTFKKPGYVTKVIEFSTHLPENVFPESIQPYYLPVRLFKTFEGVDTVFFNQPIAKIKYDGQLADFTDDRDYSLKVRYRIDEMRKNTDLINEVSSKSKFISKKSKVTISVNESEVDNIVKPDVNKVKDLINGLPSYKDEYPQGRTDEHFELNSSIVERTIFVNGKVRKVYYMIKHDWGGVFYFIDQAELGYRCISKDAYLNFLTNCENCNKRTK